MYGFLDFAPPPNKAQKSGGAVTSVKDPQRAGLKRPTGVRGSVRDMLANGRAHEVGICRRVCELRDLREQRCVSDFKCEFEERKWRGTTRAEARGRRERRLACVFFFYPEFDVN